MLWKKNTRQNITGRSGKYWEEYYVFSRWAPCEKCRPVIFLQKNSCYYAYADSYKESVKYNLSRYYVEEKTNEINEKNMR